MNKVNIIGYFEEFLEQDTHKFLGTRRVAAPKTRKTGSPGMERKTLTEDITLMKTFKTITYKASERKPLRVISIINPLCGPEKK